MKTNVIMEQDNENGEEDKVTRTPQKGAEKSGTFSVDFEKKSAPRNEQTHSLK
jgi:hypothetical protein